MNTQKSYIDFRSDTVTRPSEEMRKAMYLAEVGDDVMGDDPTVRALEEKICAILGTEGALYVSSGTQANLLSVMSHCGRGDEYIAGQGAHCYSHEGGGAAVLGSIQPQPIEFKADGTLDLDEAAAKIKPDDFHYARTRLFCLENTQDGKTLPSDYLKQAKAFCRSKGLAMHLDGARLFNAVVSSGADASEICGSFDTISVCLSKGLGAPVGSLMCGKKENINRAKRLRKMLGGGMRQAGIIAAAGLYALENNIQRLADDHENAAVLAAGLSEIKQIEIIHQSTNMVFLDLKDTDTEKFAAVLKKSGILIFPSKILRLVTHLDISRADIDKAVSEIRNIFMK